MNVKFIVALSSLTLFLLVTGAIASNSQARAITGTTLTLNSITSVPWGKNVIVIGQLKSQTGIGIGLKTITFSGTGAAGLLPTVTKSDGTFSVSGVSPKTVSSSWQVNGKFAGDSSYAASVVLRSYSTLKHNVSITLIINPQSVSSGGTFSVSGTLKDTTAGTPLSGMKITFIAPSPIFIPSTTTDSNGNYLVSGLAAPTTGSYSIKAVSLGTPLYSQYSIIKTLSVRSTGPQPNGYPVHQNILTTFFWVGEPAGPDNGFIANNVSAWDDKWQTHFGGVDDPNHRNGYYPAGFIPKENPFYFALPYDDFDNNGVRKSDVTIVYWYHSKTWGSLESMLKNQWIKITKDNKTAYAQWEDVGPTYTDDKSYVFGASPSQDTSSGLDVSPAVNDYLGLSGLDNTNWQFVNATQVPPGPWKNIITTSQICWGC